MFRAAFIAVLLTVASAGQALAAGSYRITTVDVPGSTASEATGINDRDQIVGYFYDSSLKVHGFLLSNGQFTTIDVPGATSTRVTGINNKGEMVGFYENPVGQLHGYLLSGGQFTTIDPSTGISFGRIGIDDTGRIVGTYTDAGNTQHGFLRAYGQFVSFIGRPAHGINQAGAIAGGYLTPGGSLPERNPMTEHGYRLEARGDIVSIDVPGSVGTTAHGINALGEIVGSDLKFVSGSTSLTRTHGFLFAFGAYTAIDVPGASDTFALGINNRHQIVGGYLGDSNGFVRDYGFLATPSDDIEDQSGNPSPDGTRVPQAPAVFDNQLGAWSLGPGQEILHDGIQSAGGYGAQILWYQGTIYVLGDDSNWWRWTGITWAFFGASDPTGSR